jgi:hypothetical protein
MKQKTPNGTTPILNDALAVARTIELPLPAPDTDWSKPVEYRAWFLPYNVGTGVDHVFIVGGHVATGVQVSGIVRSIALHPNGCVHVRVEVGGKGGVCKYITVKEGHGEQL